MRSGRWLNPSQPQTLQSAVILLYINAALSLLFFGVLGPYSLLVVGGGLGAGWGIANEHKWGYGVGLAVALAPFVLSIVFLHTLLSGGIITAAFDILLVVLLLHPQSRDYQRIWFK